MFINAYMRLLNLNLEFHILKNKKEVLQWFSLKYYLRVLVKISSEKRNKVDNVYKKIYDFILKILNLTNNWS